MEYVKKLKLYVKWTNNNKRHKINVTLSNRHKITKRISLNKAPSSDCGCARMHASFEATVTCRKRRERLKMKIGAGLVQFCLTLLRQFTDFSLHLDKRNNWSN